jgi:hypothetical protein
MRMLIAVMLCCAIVNLAMSADARDVFITPNGELRGSLELKDEQEGFAGISGTIWKIAREGNIERYRFVNERTDEPYPMGRLNEDEIASLGHLLAREDFLGLPTDIKNHVHINPRRVSITFGSKTSTLMLEPGQSLEDAASHGDPSSAKTKLLKIALGILALVHARN